MNWLDESGRFSKGCDADELMEAVQNMSADFSSVNIGNAATTLSNAFKDETACGLISKGLNLKGVFDPRQDRMFAGEKLNINEKIYEVLDRVTDPEVGTVKSYKIAETNELRRFIKNFDDALRSLQITSLIPISKITDSTRLWPEIETEMRAICLERVDKEFSDIEPEPPFISGLKALSRVLSREWSERY
jgi:hypothetical protein